MVDDDITTGFFETMLDECCCSCCFTPIVDMNDLELKFLVFYSRHEGYLRKGRGQGILIAELYLIIHKVPRIRYA